MPKDAGQEPVEYAECHILHIDMDAFYVSVELLDHPHLRGVPVVVGSPSGRSVVLSASYEARRFGVRSAMPMAVAMRQCPTAVILPPHHRRYSEVSAQVMGIFRSVTPEVEQLSVDEAFLDVAGSLRRLGSPRAIGEQIRAEIHSTLGITASVGAATTKFVAKIASTRAKPDGLLLIPGDQTVAYLHTLPVSALWGVGAKTQEVLARIGIRTVQDVAHTPVATLRRLLGASGEHVHHLAWGRDPRRVVVSRPEKSIGAEETFSRDVEDSDVLRRELLRLAHRTATRLRASGHRAGSVALKLRYEDFSTLTRSKKLDEPVDNANALYRAATALLAGLGDRPMAVRLIGLRAESLVTGGDGSTQLTIDRQDDNWRLAERALDDVNRKFGDAGVMPAGLLARGRPPAPPGKPGGGLPPEADDDRAGTPPDVRGGGRPPPSGPSGGSRRGPVQGDRDPRR
ncbi:DNA polymerase IV [Arthrobacter sp. SX1312]|uniref:DNA polymerase IV n=1 Tax=Arthrobacter sp. SX1312 TaxID=2058896 RepID=UPI0021570035|nr:DNA polymerase IV [Arthrobacter sp. SX1312]